MLPVRRKDSVKHSYHHRHLILRGKLTHPLSNHHQLLNRCPRAVVAAAVAPMLRLVTRKEFISCLILLSYPIFLDRVTQSAIMIDVPSEIRLKMPSVNDLMKVMRIYLSCVLISRRNQSFIMHHLD